MNDVSSIPFVVVAMRFIRIRKEPCFSEYYFSFCLSIICDILFYIPQLMVNDLVVHFARVDTIVVVAVVVVVEVDKD
jgi:hypothetical protein